MIQGNLAMRIWMAVNAPALDGRPRKIQYGINRHLFDGMNMERILRLPAVLAHCGFSRSSVYARIARGLWPAPVRLGQRAVGWPESEIEAIITACIAGKSDAEVRSLVATIQAARRTQ